jgi:single-strand DNA-binding protein
MSVGNNVYLTGNVTRSPEGRYTPSGQYVAEFGLAVNESWIPKGGGDRQERTHYFDVTVWRELAENVVETVTKGMRVCVEGKMDFQEWEDKDSGSKRNKLKVLAEEVSPSLRWATAVVTKNERNGGGRGEPAGAERYDEPAQGGSQPRQQQRSQQQAPANNGDPGPQYDYDGMDEPF